MGKLKDWHYCARVDLKGKFQIKTIASYADVKYIQE